MNLSVNVSEVFLRTIGVSESPWLSRSPLLWSVPWHEMWEIDAVSIIREDFIEENKDRSKDGWVPKMATLFQGIHWVFVGINFLRAHQFLR